MKVSDLIQVLQGYPQDLEVAYELFSEYSLLLAKELTVQELCAPRPDGWVHAARPDKPLQQYLVFPGN